MECFQCRFSSCEQNEAVSFGFSGGLVGDDVAILYIAEGFEGGEYGLARGVPAEAVDEDFSVRDVSVCHVADVLREGRDLESYGGYEIDELVFGVGFEEFREGVRAGTRIRIGIGAGIALWWRGLFGLFGFELFVDLLWFVFVEFLDELSFLGFGSLRHLRERERRTEKREVNGGLG